MATFCAAGSWVIQGRFPGGRPTIIQLRPARLHPQPPAYVQEAIHRGAPHFYHLAAQRKAIEQAHRQAEAAPLRRQGDATLLPGTFRFAPSIGAPLPPAVQRKMELFFGVGFSDVRVHVGPQAGQIGARAFTRGSDLYFAPGQYMPHHSHGQRLLGHELAHVVQQRAGRVHNPFGRGMAVVHDPRLEAEADRVGLHAATYRPTPGTIQRMRGDDLKEASEKALEIATVKRATEVQAIHADGSVALTANAPASLLAISSLQAKGILAQLETNPGGNKLSGGVKSAGSYIDCASKLAAKDKSLILLTGGDGDYHAEQRLLIALAHMIKNGSIPDTLHIWGAKPPCGSCKAVLKAFNKALDNTYDKVIIYSGEAGQPRDVSKISLADIFGDSGDENFKRFVGLYTKYLSEG